MWGDAGGAAVDEAFAGIGFGEAEFGEVSVVDFCDAEGLLVAEFGVDGIDFGVTLCEAFFEPVDLLATVLVFLGGDVGVFFTGGKSAVVPPFAEFQHALNAAGGAY